MFGIYVHYPFCRKICPYCDFNVHRLRPTSAGRQGERMGGVRMGGERMEGDDARWGGFYAREIAYLAGLRRGLVSSVFLGGGTPSLMPHAVLEDVLCAIDTHYGLASDVEVSLEANPADIDDDYLRTIKSIGVNRLSLGVQSFDDGVLRFLGRNHDAAMARRAWDKAGRVFSNLSLDIIYAAPDQTPAQWRDALTDILRLMPPHISLYQLTIEAGTAFAKSQAAGRLTMPDEDAMFDFYTIAQDLCAQAGLDGYEVSNYARAGQMCRHNVNIWRGGDYVGVGAGAHGRLTIDGVRYATEIEANPQAWQRRIEAQGHGMISQIALTPRAAYEEAILTGLRLHEGVAKARLDDAFFNASACNTLIDMGFLGQNATHIYATSRGRMVLDSLVGELAV